MDTTDDGRAARVLDAVEGSSALLLGVLGTRLELFAHELRIEAARLRSSAVLMVAALVCASLALVLLVLLAVVLFWDTHRVATIAISIALLLTLAGGLALASRRRIYHGTPFAATLGELAADRAVLGEETPQ